MADVAEPISARSVSAGQWRTDLSVRIRSSAEYVCIPLFALGVSALLFSLFLLALGKSPVQFFSLVNTGGFGTAFSIQNTLQRASPLILTALAVVPLLILTLMLLQYGKVIRGVACAGTAALVLFASVYGYQLPHLQTIWMSPRIAEAVARARPCARTIVATAPYIEPSLVFVLGTGTELTDVKGVAEHLRRDPACGLGLVGAQERS